MLNELRNKLDYHLWYQFGIELGVQKLFLDSIKSCPNYECMIELVDYWLRNHPGQPTWNEIKAALDKMTEYKNKSKIRTV